MYFKKLELFGFKSFADKTELTFEPGITAIVGPNGCGKTNVSDAIRWVLGEQSARQLRGLRMEDVIFNGSGTRKPVSMVEVSLSLDNSQHVLPIDYAEVIITRRIFRSGENEYFINKNPCRLKDISELFMDTGIGTDSYSLMEGAKIDLILSPKSEDRRFLFEEAAGIMKYKTRRDEALSKLEKTEQNLTRLGDIIQEVKSRVSSLDYQVRKARQYQKYKQTIKNHQIELLRYELGSLSKDLCITTDEFGNLTDEIEKLNVLISQKEADIAGIKLELTKEEEKIFNVQTDLSEINGELQRREERISNIKEKEGFLATEEDRLNKEIKLEEEKLHKIKDKNARIEKQLKDLNEYIETKEQTLNEKNELLQRQNKELENITGDLESKKETVFNLLNEIARRRNEMTALSVTEKNIKVQKDKLDKEKTHLESLQDDIKGRIETIKNLLTEQENELNSNIQSKDAIIGEVKQKEKAYSVLTEQFDKLKEEFSVKSSRCEFLERLQSNFEGYDVGVKEVLTQKFSGIYGTVASLIDVNAGYEVAIEEALGDRLQYIVAQNIEITKDVIKYLRDNDKGQVNFLVLKSAIGDFDSFKNYLKPAISDIPAERIISKGVDLLKFDSKYRPIMEYLLGDVLVVDNFDTALKISDTPDFKGKVVTLEGELIDKTSGNTLVLRGGSRFKESKFLGRKREIKELKETLLPDISGEINKIKAEKDALEGELKDKFSKIEGLNLNIKKLEVTLDTNRREYEKLQQEKDRVLKQIETLEIEYIGWEKESDQICFGIDNLNKSIKELERNNKESQENIAKLETGLQNKSDFNVELNEQITGIKIDLAQQRQKKENLLYELERLKEEIKGLNESLENKKSEISSGKDKFSELNTSIKEENEKIESLWSKKDITEKSIRQILENRQQLMSILNEKEEAIHSDRNSIEKQKAIFHQKELKNAQVNAHIEELKNRLVGDYNVKPEELNLQEQPAPDIENRKLELAKIKKKIESIGAVNLVAIDEYQELEERCKFLTKQQEDLIKAKEDLTKVIEKTNTTARTHFKETFEQIRRNFIRICKELFEGGEGDLILSAPDNLLETGIEIIVQPPGKKLESISLLSAGEKTLTAIALLFSIFMVKPSPFCVLDEIDAALDEANIQRFTSMLKDFAQKSQFIVITHNKRTMEIADVLYGITMEEFGVSKLVSVKFKKAETVEVNI